MKTAKIKLMGDCLRIDLRCDNSNATARAEIEITKIIQGNSCMPFPDGAVIGRKQCGPDDVRLVQQALVENGWTVASFGESECAMLTKIYSILQARHPNHMIDINIHYSPGVPPLTLPFYAAAANVVGKEGGFTTAGTTVDEALVALLLAIENRSM